MREKVVAFLLFAAFASSSAAAETKITGRVLDENGKPVAGAALTLYELTSNEVSGITVRVVSTVESGPDGGYAVSADEPQMGTTGICYPMLIAQKDGLALGWLLFFPGVEGSDLVLKTPARVAGAVVDEAGKPVAGAAVRIMLMRMEGRQPAFAYGCDGVEPLMRRTDADGRFAYDAIPSDASAEIIVSAPGLATMTTMPDQMSMPLSIPAGKEDLALVMPREGRIAGSVVDEAGKPCAGVAVFAAPRQMNPFLSVSAVTDADGRFSIGGLGPREWSVALAPAGPGAPELIAKPVVVTAKSGETAEATIRLEAGGLLEVRVVEAADGAPIPDVQVGARTIAGSQLGRPAQSVTDIEGIARFRLSEAEYAVTVMKQGYKYPSEGIREKVTIGQTAHIEVRLEKASTVTGIVLDEDGKPIEGAEVQLPAFGRPIVTDGAGKFEVTMQRELSQWDSRAIIARHAKRNLAAVLDNADLFLGPVSITLKPAATIKGRVADEAGKPIPGAEAQAYVWTGQAGHSVGAKAVSDAEGAYSISAVPAGSRVTVDVGARGYGRDNPPVPVLSAGATDIGTSTLKRADKSIAGVVIGLDGKPASGAEIYIQGAQQPHMLLRPEQVKSDDQGRFRVDGVVDGELYVNARISESNLYQSVQASAGDMNLRIVLQQQASAMAESPEASEPAPLAGKPLPDLSTLFAVDELKALEGKRLIVVVFDVDSRPSRAALAQLAAKSDAFAKANAAVIGIDVSGGDVAALSAWVKTTALKMPLAAGGGKADELRKSLGAKSLPWLVLADEKRLVRAEGFMTNEAEAKVGALGE